MLKAPTVVATVNRLGATPAQVTLAWLLKKSPNLLLIPGTSSLAHLRENLAAAQLEPTPKPWMTSGDFYTFTGDL